MKHPSLRELRIASEKGLAFLRGEQVRNGSFTGQSSADRSDFRQAQKVKSIFPTALILRALHAVGGAEKIADKAAAYLLREKSREWTWNYWERGSTESRKHPYPDDLDDTFVSLAALRLWRPDIFNAEVMVPVARTLTRLEVRPGGPYRTWVVPASAEAVWRDVDPAVNANIAHFLGLCGIRLRGLDGMLAARTGARSLRSPYYPEYLPVAYFMALRGECPPKVQKLLWSRLRTARTALPLALTASSLLSLGVPPSRLALPLRRLLAMQEGGGGWAAEGFCLDPEAAREPRYAGAPALTTAFALEAFGRFLRAKEAEESRKGDRRASTFLSKVYALAEERSLQMPGELAREWRQLAARIKAADSSGTVALLPYYFRQSLGGRSGKIKEDKLVLIGYANLCGWMAYTAYDDILDGEKRGEELSAANAALRELAGVYGSIFEATRGGRQKFRKIMDGIDGANAWELLHCRMRRENGKLIVPVRLPAILRSGSLSAKSLGHALAPLAILALSGHPASSPAFKSTEEFFRRYLAARQLNDDAHDWLEDIKEGRLNFAGARVLRHYSKGQPFTVGQEERRMQILFWEKEIVHVVRAIRREIALARRALRKIPLQSTVFLEGLLEPLEKAGEEALRESREGRKFAAIYNRRGRT